MPELHLNLTFDAETGLPIIDLDVHTNSDVAMIAVFLVAAGFTCWLLKPRM
jgi:hypothetical protein